MLPKKYRADKKAVDKIWKEGYFLRSPNLTFKFLINKNDPDPHLAMVAPKSIAKSAVKRNLLRRRGYKVLSEKLQLLTGITGAFIFGKNSLREFGGKKSKNHNPLLALEQEFDNIIKKIRK